MKTILILGALATLATVPAYAQHMNEQDSPCASVVITAELTDCLSSARDKADTKLNTVYREVRSHLQAEDAERLTKTQRLWLQYRDANCTAERDLYEGGTAKYPAYFACLESMTRARTPDYNSCFRIVRHPTTIADWTLAK